MKKHFAIGSSKKPRKVLIYEGTHCFDGVKYFHSKRLLEFGITKSKKSKFLPIKKDPKKSFEECYIELTTMADKVIADTDGKINMYKTGSIATTALNLFFDMTSVDVEDISSTEAEWLNNCNHGALIYQHDYKGELHSYDINSMYLSIMQNKYFKIPIKQGTFSKITEEEFNDMKFFKFGIYRVHIEYDDKYRKLFRFNKNDYYTSNDLTQAKTYGLKMNIEDCSLNFLAYGEGTFKTGSQLFKDYVEYMYALRKTHNDKVYKLISNALWGALVQSNIITLTYKLTDDFDFDFNDTATIIDQSMNGDTVKIKYVKHDKYFKYPFARLKPFILAFGRQMLGRIIEPHVDDIVRIHTDGFSCSKELNIVLGDNMGELRFDGHIANAHVQHVNKIIDLDA